MKQFHATVTNINLLANSSQGGLINVFTPTAHSLPSPSRRERSSWRWRGPRRVSEVDVGRAQGLDLGAAPRSRAGASRAASRARAPPPPAGGTPSTASLLAIDEQLVDAPLERPVLVGRDARLDAHVRQLLGVRVGPARASASRGSSSVARCTSTARSCASRTAPASLHLLAGVQLLDRPSRSAAPVTVALGIDHLVAHRVHRPVEGLAGHARALLEGVRARPPRRRAPRAPPPPSRRRSRPFAASSVTSASSASASSSVLMHASARTRRRGARPPRTSPSPRRPAPPRGAPRSRGGDARGRRA